MHPSMAEVEAYQPGLSLEVAGNRLTLLADGPERLDALLDLIGGAKESLRFLYYMFMDDSSGTGVRDALIAAIAVQAAAAPNATTLLRLAEAYAWVVEPAQPHGGGERS